MEHFDAVAIEDIDARFDGTRRHRAYLRLPYRDRKGDTLCIIGQNPSYADAHRADKTLRFLEEYVHRNLSRYGQIIMLNLFTRVDTTKSEKGSVLLPEFATIFEQIVSAHNHFLAVFGKPKVEGSYSFNERVAEIAPMFAGKQVYKFDLGTNYAPHPGNPRISYANYDVGITSHTFEA